MSGDKNSSMNTTLPVPLRMSPREVVRSDEDEPIATQDMSDADVTPNDRLQNMRRFQELTRNCDPAEIVERYSAELELEREEAKLAELKRRRALLVELLDGDAGDEDDSFSLDGKLIPCSGNIAFHCMVGYYKESLSTCPFCDSLWTSIRGRLIDGVRDQEDEDVDGHV